MVEHKNGIDSNPAEFQLNSKIFRYEEFLNEKLRTDLRNVHEQRDKLYKEISDYMQFNKIVEAIKLRKDKNDIVKTKIDLGCNFYCQALIPDSSKVYVLIGYGYFLEMTLDEAESFVEQKIKTLTLKGDLLTKDSAKIKANIRLVLEGLRELQNLKVTKSEQRRDLF